MQQGDGDAAARGLNGAADAIKEMEASNQDLEDLREQLQRLQDAKDSC